MNRALNKKLVEVRALLEAGPVEHAKVEGEIRSVLDHLTKVRQRAEKYHKGSPEGSGKERLGKALKKMTEASKSLSSAAAFW